MQNGNALNQVQQLAQAKVNSLELFSSLFLEGVTADLLPYIQSIPIFKDVLPGSVDLDEIAATHYNLFSANIFPYATLFLTEEGLLGGEVSNELLELYQQTGYIPVVSSEAADHLGHQLSFLAFLISSELAAHQSQPELVPLWQSKQISFLENHLLPWMLPCLLAVEEVDSGLFAKAAELTRLLVLTHFTELATTNASPHDESPPAAEKPHLLEDDRTGLREISHFLMTPCLSGLFLSGQVVSNLARHLELPRGFGNRQQIMLNLIRTAVQYDALERLLLHLKQLLNKWQMQYETITNDFPQAETFIEPWLVRLNHTQQLLDNISRQSKSFSSS